MGCAAGRVGTRTFRQTANDFLTGPRVKETHPNVFNTAEPGRPDSMLFDFGHSMFPNLFDLVPAA